jgi:hypothetical protein
LQWNNCQFAIAIQTIYGWFCPVPRVGVRMSVWYQVNWMKCTDIICVTLSCTEGWVRMSVWYQVNWMKCIDIQVSMNGGLIACNYFITQYYSSWWNLSMSTDAGASLFEHSWLSFLTQAAPISLASDSAWHAFQPDRGRNFIKYSWCAPQIWDLRGDHCNRRSSGEPWLKSKLHRKCMLTHNLLVLLRHYHGLSSRNCKLQENAKTCLDWRNITMA